MHESSFIKSIIDNVNSMKEEGKVISQVNIELGELVGIDSHHLIHHLNEESPYIFNITSKPSLIRCTCSYEGPAEVLERLHDLVIWKCPLCEEQIKNIELLEGDKLIIKSLVYK